jgi:putative glutamine amidotransferase
MSRVPLVAITATTEVIRGVPRVRVNQAYTDALLAAGLIPVIVPPVADEEALDRVLEGVDGLVLSGGEDVAPRHYGAAPHRTVTDIYESRDSCELTLVRLAAERRVPTLAICRGIQVVNVALGGTLVQDIPSERPSAIGHDAAPRRTERVHGVTVEAGSRLAEALGSTSITANSLHHQSIARVASGLSVTAQAEDGIVEGVEPTAGEWWMLGVQWHPEELTGTPEEWDRRLFRAFAVRVRGARTPATAGR